MKIQETIFMDKPRIMSNITHIKISYDVLQDMFNKENLDEQNIFNMKLIFKSINECHNENIKLFLKNYNANQIKGDEEIG